MYSRQQCCGVVRWPILEVKHSKSHGIACLSQSVNKTDNGCGFNLTYPVIVMFERKEEFVERN